MREVMDEIRSIEDDYEEHVQVYCGKNKMGRRVYVTKDRW
jgi:hypothetical protein